MKSFEKYKSVEQYANAYARSMGYGVATGIKRGEKTRIAERVDTGYRKNTTGEYVANAYRNNFGWKNTYYQNAETVVEIKAEEFDYLVEKVKDLLYGKVDRAIQEVRESSHISSDNL